jgi:hypothetical protein
LQGEDNPDEKIDVRLIVNSETGFPSEGIQLVVKKRKEFLDKKLCKAIQVLRREDKKERGICHIDLIPAWKKEIVEKLDKLIVPRAAFTLGKKLKEGLKKHLDRIPQALRMAEDYVDTEEEFEATFEYMQYLMRKHIIDSIC